MTLKPRRENKTEHGSGTPQHAREKRPGKGASRRTSGKRKKELFGLLSFFGDWKEAPLMEPEETEIKPQPVKACRKSSLTLNTEDGGIQVENYISWRKLKKVEIEEGIYMFSRGNPERQREALINVSKMNGGNIITGVKGNQLISYIGIHHPMDRQRWGRPGYDWLYELGAIEVSRNYRSIGLGGAMMEVAFQDPVYDGAIVFTTGFTWHWDLEGSGLDKMEYRIMGAKLFSRYGFVEMETDEPNVSMDSANIFMVRVGKDVPFSRKRQFASLLFTDEWEALKRESPGLD